LSIRIEHGDCFDIMRALPANAVELVLTDIPYDEVNDRAEDQGGLRELDKGYADVATFELAPFVEELVRVCSGTFAVWCGTMQVSELMRLFRAHGLILPRVGVWEKTNPSPVNAQHFYVSGLEFCVLAKKRRCYYSRGYAKAKWTGPVVPSSRRRHVTEKPVWLFEEQLIASTLPGMTVLDPCAGAGPAAEAALRTGRNAIVCDIVEANFHNIRRRVSATRGAMWEAEFAANPPRDVTASFVID